MISVCFECTDRTETCHGSCEKYLEARQKHIAEKAAITKQKIEERRYRDYVIDSKAKIDSKVRSTHRQKKVKKHEV